MMMGPFLKLEPEGLKDNKIVKINNSLLRLDIKVMAPSWMDINSIEIIKNGERYLLEEIPKSTDKIRLDKVFKVSFEKDGWFLVNVKGKEQMMPVDNAIPKTYSNPYYVDADGDGKIIF